MSEESRVPRRHVAAPALALVLVVTCGAQFMAVVDDTVVAMALPSIRTDLGFGAADLAWVIDAYMLMFGGLLILGGRLADHVGAPRVFRLGLALFTVASMACGLAHSQGVMIAARAVQGIGAALLSPAALTMLVTATTSADERKKVLGAWGGVTGVAGVSGVVLGGVVTQMLDWRWVFLINVPIGILLLLLTAKAAGPAREREPGQRLDVLGGLLLTAGLLVAINAVLGTAHRAWSDPFTLFSFAVSAVLLVMFVLVERRQSHPLIPARVLTTRSVLVANIVMFLAAGGLYATFFFLTQYLQTINRIGAMEAGFRWVPFGLSMAMATGAAINLLPRWGVRVLVTTGLAVAAVGMFLLQRTDAGSSYVSTLLPSLVLCGLGYGLTMAPLVYAGVSGTRPGDSGAASGIINSGQQVGGAVGLAVMATVANHAITDRLRSGAGQTSALLDGFHTAFICGAVVTAAAALLALALVPLRGDFDVAATHGFNEGDDHERP